MEQRANIKFCFKLGRTATETHEMLVKVDAVSEKCVFEWFKRFRDGKEDVEDGPRSGRPPTSTTSDNIERVRRMLADDRRLSLRMIAEELKISLDSVSCWHVVSVNCRVTQIPGSLKYKIALIQFT
ncbi:Putative uncharacterized protein FLJ37770 [Araneus ventricosus]|uniref:Mos1 transposase HTH domain-containing protein n=1 Tax=Araneus ventricosus TaxID=182803 RepID=A0A4Y2PDX6_ARAVE|nr:Putative uncharacterized protein FLJ37770 [Araneus ventricosus]